MAMLNEILGAAARYQQLLTRKFGLTGGAPSPQLTPEIAPVFEIARDPENAIIRGELLAAGTVSIAPMVAGLSTAMLWNPVGSNILLVVEHIEGYDGTALAAFLGILDKVNPTGATVPVGQTGSRDGRVTATGAFSRLPAGQLYGDGSAAPINAELFLKPVPQNVLFTFDVPVIIPPGWRLAIQCNTANHQTYTSFAWREVPLAAGEAGPF